jgi:hypothetical protein
MDQSVLFSSIPGCLWWSRLEHSSGAGLLYVQCNEHSRADVRSLSGPCSLVELRALGIVNGKVECDFRLDRRLVGSECELKLRTRMGCSRPVLSTKTLVNADNSKKLVLEVLHFDSL